MPGFMVLARVQDARGIVDDYLWERERDKRSGSGEARGYVDRAGVGRGDAFQGVREQMLCCFLTVMGAFAPTLRIM